MCKESEKKTESTQTQAIPDWLESVSRSLAERTQAQAEKPFEVYSGDRVADLTGDQQTAFQKLRDFVGGGETTAPLRDAMTKPAGTVGTERVVDEDGRLGAISGYLNPYVENALQPALTKIQEQADGRRKQINAGATAARAFGDARHGIAESTLDKNTSQAIGDTASSFMMNAFDKSMATRGGDLNRFTDADLKNAQLEEQALNRGVAGSQAMQNQMLQQLQALLNAGGIQQGNEQMELDTQYQEFIRKISNDPQQLNLLASVLGRLPYSKTTTGSATETSPDNSLLGVAGALGGAVLGSNPVASALASLFTSSLGGSTSAGKA